MTFDNPLSPLDDYPVHQIAEPMRYAGPSDRNFYDRYYFNMHSCSDDVFCIFGLGQYPNLGTTDAFFCVRRTTPGAAGSDMQRVVRSSRELGLDRMDTRVGPIRIEVLEGLKRLRVIVEPNDAGVAADITWTGSHHPTLEPRHFIRKHGRVTFDTQRLAQNGVWEGTLEVAGETLAVTPDRWWGSRDRSWGVRPVGEPEAPGIQGSQMSTFYWNYAPVRFDEFSFIYICQEERDGTRVMETGELMWPDATGKPMELLGRPEHDLHFVPGTRIADRGVIRFPHAIGGPIEVDVEMRYPVYLGIGTGYGAEPGWRHGMYQGQALTEAVVVDLATPEAQAQKWGIIDSVGRFTVRAPARPELDGKVGHGLWEFMIIGPHDQYGFQELLDGAK